MTQALKSCVDCPSYVQESDVGALPTIAGGRSTGAAMCSRYGHALYSPVQDDEARDATAKWFAMNCDSWGEDRFTGKIPDGAAAVMVPDEVAVTITPKGSLTTCNSCENCVRPAIIMAESGFSISACKARGILITHASTQCKNCAHATPGAVSDDMGTMKLAEQYRPLYRLPDEMALGAYFSLNGSNVDPLAYESDVELTEEDVANGIRAWREVKDPFNPNNPESVFLPIFDPSAFDDFERSLIPRTGDATHPELYIDHQGLSFEIAAEAVGLGETIALIGNAGDGKTEVARFLAWMMQVPFRRFNFDKNSDPDDYRGFMKLTPDEGTVFVPGRFVTAWQSVGVMVCDEINAAPDEIWQMLRPALDNSGVLVVEYAHANFEKNPWCIPLFPMNPAWDSRNLGVSELASADANRLSPIEVHPPPTEVERRIVRDRCLVDGYVIPDEVLEMCMAIAKDIRNLEEEDVYPDHFGVRQMIKFARMTRYYDAERALRRTTLDFYDPAIRAQIIKVAATHFVDATSTATATASNGQPPPPFPNATP